MDNQTEPIPIVILTRKIRHWARAVIGRAAASTSFPTAYAWLAFMLLLATATFWAILGARLQATNADQLADPYLFNTAAIFHGANFPGAHSFLLKWPIFWLVSLVGSSATSLLVATVAVCLMTVASLAFILYKIDRRPLVFGSLCLVLAVVLLLVPAQPYAGGLLPVNMAMLTTRNIEYIVYIGALVCIIRTRHYRNRRFIGGVLLLTLLVASDKLFLSLSGGGALVALIVYAFRQNWAQVNFAVRWLVASVLSAVGSAITLAIISALHVTHFVNESGASPYALAAGLRSFVTGAAYAVLGLLTNLGSNPVYDNREIAQLPTQAFHRVFSFSGAAHMLSVAALVYAMLLVWRVLWPSLRVSGAKSKTSTANQLSLALLWSTLVALVSFIATNHYYPVDARYLTISLFAVAISAATVLRARSNPRQQSVAIFGVVAMLGVIMATFAAYGTYSNQRTALADINNRDQLVAQTLAHHKVDVLVGDYWRVLPIHADATSSFTAQPLADCTQPRDSLTSTVWQSDLSNHSFAYLITFDGSLTGYPNCSLVQITANYGRPNATQLIAGTLAQPKEVLLFYDHGKHTAPSLPKRTTDASALLPITLDQLVGSTCDTQTSMNVVAHEDDDILFMNPDVQHDIDAGHCVRTVYLTAGDAGEGKLYWLSRQLGAEAAYSSMLGDKSPWVQRTVELAAGEYATIASPQDNTHVSLIFLNLPDGGIHGTGFSASGSESLEKLQSGFVASLSTVDAQSAYTSHQLEAALAELMTTYAPAVIRTQADVVSGQYPDHSDHIATGHFAVAATKLYDQEHFGGMVNIPVERYIGYPIHSYAANVSDGDLSRKEAAFFAYAQYDGGVCHSVAQCAQTPTYGSYLARQYQENPAQE